MFYFFKNIFANYKHFKHLIPFCVSPSSNEWRLLSSEYWRINTCNWVFYNHVLWSLMAPEEWRNSIYVIKSNTSMFWWVCAVQRGLLTISFSVWSTIESLIWSGAPHGLFNYSSTSVGLLSFYRWRNGNYIYLILGFCLMLFLNRDYSLPPFLEHFIIAAASILGKFPLQLPLPVITWSTGQVVREIFQYLAFPVYPKLKEIWVWL